MGGRVGARFALRQAMAWWCYINNSYSGMWFYRLGAKNLFKVFLEIALECNRDEWMLRMRRMGSCPCKQPGRPIARFHSNPAGKCLAGRSAALRRLPIARAIGCAPRLASHPGKVLVRLQKDLEQALTTPATTRRLCWTRTATTSRPCSMATHSAVRRR